MLPAFIRSLVTVLVIAVFVSLNPCWAQDSNEPVSVEPAEVDSEAAEDQQRVFQGTVTVRDSPIVEGSDLDSLASLVTTVSDQQVDDLTFRNTAPYVMLSHSFGESITVTPSAGVRYNDSRYFGNEWGGQAGSKVGISNHTLYGNWAHAFNLPGVYAAVQYGGRGLGDRWQELKAETIDHLEVGWLAPLGGRWRLDVSVFRDDVNNAIRFVPPPPPPPSFANVGAYTVNGVDFGF